MKKSLMMIALMLVSSIAFAQSEVYLTRDISPESLVKIYKALGVPAKGRVAVKISTGEGSTHLQRFRWCKLHSFSKPFIPPSVMSM